MSQGFGRGDTAPTRAYPRVAAVIPALDEAPSIGRVVRQLRAQRLVPLDLVTVVVREERRGYGYACHAGVLAADGAEVIVLLEGDAADDPDDLPRILGPLLDGEAELVVGSRTLGSREAGSMTPQQVLGNRLASWLMRHLYGVAVTDLGPFRAIRRSDLLGLETREMTYGWSVEMMVKAAWAGHRYREVPVSYDRRIGVSKVGGTVCGSLWAGWCILSTTFRYARWTPRPRTGPLAVAG